MTFAISDFPRLLPELMLLLLGLLVLGSDVLERWGATSEALAERAHASGQLAATGLGLVFVVALVQSRYLFSVGGPVGNSIVDALLNLVRNLQDAGPGDSAILGAFATDDLTMIARLTFIGAAFLTAMLCLGFNPTNNPGEFYALLLFATAGMCIMAAASELILAYLSLELSSIALYVLAGYFRSDPRSSEAGLKYFLFGVLSSAILLYGMSLAYGITASANAASGNSQVIGTLFSSIGLASQQEGATPVLALAIVFIVAGIGYKIAVVPFHSWSPDVYEGAPTPITAFISTASKTAGFLLLYRLLSGAFPSAAGAPGLNGGWASLLTLIAALTIVVGNLSAIPQTNAKRLLAYSSIGHAGFVLMALILWGSAGLGDRTLGVSTMLYYLVAYTLTNLGAFGALAVVGQALGGDDIADLNGLGRRNVGLATMLTVLVLSLAGVPPLAGYWAKFFVFMTGYKAGAVWLVVLAVAMTIVSLYYYLRLLRAIWIAEPASAEPVATPATMNVALVVSTVLVVALGLAPNLIWGILGQASAVAGGG